MLAFAVFFLVCQAILIVIQVDVPTWRESFLGTSEVTADFVDGAQSSSDSLSLESEDRTMIRVQSYTLVMMLFLWPAFILESCYHWIIRPKLWSLRWYHFSSLLHVICPSLRLAARSLEMDRRIWLPRLGWQRIDQRLRRRIERELSLPMIVVALLILPILLIEVAFQKQVATHVWLRWIMHIGTGVIWFAFAAEFILMLAISRKKMAYVKTHWIDLAIIALPLFSFLRGLALVRTTRLARLAKVSRITKLVKAYRLRGTMMRVVRAVVILRVFDKLIKLTPESRMRRLEERLAITQREERMIRFEIARLRRSDQESESKTN
ncbi:MAG: potassium channel protein [Planctomycetota bacterium]